MERIEDMRCTDTVQRAIPAHVRIIQGLLYAAVAVFTLIGTMGGLYWGVMAVLTLVFAWYYMGIARTTFVYLLEGRRLRIQRISGFASRPRTEEFAQFDLTALRALGLEDSPELSGEEAASRGLRPRRVVYDLTSHDRNRDCHVMYLDGAGSDAGRRVKVCFEPSKEMLRCILRAAPAQVRRNGQ